MASRCNRDGIARAAEQLVAGFRHPHAHRSINAVANLSGGNQQKVIVAREFSRPTQAAGRLQPTRGLDVGSIEYIHRRIVEQARRGLPRC